MNEKALKELKEISKFKSDYNNFYKKVDHIQFVMNDGTTKEMPWCFSEELMNELFDDIDDLIGQKECELDND